MTTTSDVLAAVRRLRAVVEPWLWADVTDRHLLNSHMRPVATEFELRGIVKPDGLPAYQEPTDQKDAYLQAREARDHLTCRAEAAILAAEQAGFRHADYPRIEVSGRVRTYPTEPGRPDDLTECEVEVIMTLEERS